MKRLLLNIRDLNSDGQGVAMSDSGKVVFVDGALPGERVLVRMTQEKKNYGKAKILEIEVPSSGRTTPKCPWFGTCGGCQLQHGTYDLQITMKENMVKSAMERIGGVSVDGLKCVPSDRLWGYRNKASFPIRWGRGGGIGFFRSSSHSVVPIERCPILLPTIDSFYSKIRKDMLDKFSSNKFMYDEVKHTGLLRHLVLRSNNEGDLILMLVALGSNETNMRLVEDVMETSYRKDLDSMSWNINNKKSNRIIGDVTVPVWGENVISEKLGQFSLSYDGTAFFQVNTPQAERLFSLAAQWADCPGGKLVELYSGVGALTSFLAQRAKSVLAVEEWGPSVDRLRENMAANGIDNVKALCGRAEKLIRSMLEEKPEVIVVDPPRTGCDPEVLSAMTTSVAKRIVYVSCNPATLARDAAILRKSGWSLKDIKSFDLFPQTCHVECVCLMSRVDK